MYSALSFCMEGNGSGGGSGGVGEYQNMLGDACLVLTADHKPRLRWTAELHERFVDAVTQLGGPDSKFTNIISSFFFLLLVGSFFILESIF